MQLVLSTVYHADVPTGNIALSETKRWSEDRRIAETIPLSLGDSARGFRIVGTTHAYPSIYDAEVREGRLWEASLEAVLGADVARATGLGPGDFLTGSHGMSGMGDSHAESPYRIVGVLASTGAVVDRLILTGLDSVWDIHGGEHDHGWEEPAAPGAVGEIPSDEHVDHGDEHAGESGGEHADEPGDEHHGHEEEFRDDHADEHDEHGVDADHDDDVHADDDDREITAMLVRYASPVAAVSLPRQINAESNLQAAAPAFELARLLKIVGLGLDGLRAFALILIASAAFSVFGAMYGALRARRGELAMMRCLGGTRVELMASLLIEGLLLGLAGTALGLLVGHATVEAMGALFTDKRGIALTGRVLLFDELLLALALVVVALIAAAVPAWQAYRTDVSRTLASHG